MSIDLRENIDPVFAKLFAKMESKFLQFSLETLSTIQLQYGAGYYITVAFSKFQYINGKIRIIFL